MTEWRRDRREIPDVSDGGGEIDLLRRPRAAGDRRAAPAGGRAGGRRAARPSPYVDGGCEEPDKLIPPNRVIVF